MDREFERALWILSGTEIMPAEALRRLIPIAARTGIERPSYGAVRRIFLEQRELRRRRRERLEPILCDLLHGRIPNLYYHIK